MQSKSAPVQPSAFTNEEQNDGFQLIWADSLDHAIALFEADAPTAYDGRDIKPRDLLFLKAAQALSEKMH